MCFFNSYGKRSEFSSCHIEKKVKRQTTQEILNNRFRIKASIDIVCWLTFQACAFRRHDERPESKNRGNFLEMLELLASFNEQVGAFILDNAPQNAKYTSHQIQFFFFCMSLLEMFSLQFVMILVMQDFA